MRKIYPLALLLLMVLAGTGAFGQTIVIGAGATSGTSSNGATGDPGPMYRSSNSSNFVYSRHHYLYTEAELTAAGLVAGSIITQLAWNKDNDAATNSPADFEIWMKNSSLTAVQTPTQEWANLTSLGGATQVYSAPTTVTSAIGWVSMTLSTPFTYTGGALEISVAFDISSGNNPWTTAGFSWKKDNINNRTISYCNSVAGTGLNNLRTVRPQIQITYMPGTPCTNPPTAGTVVASNVGPVCPGTAINLNLSGNSVGSGLTYEWESSPTNAPFTPTSLGAASLAPVLTINPTTTAWYRAKVVCSGGTPVYSAPVQIQVAGGLPGGTYTINGGAPTAGTNFNSFADAIDALSCGITGPIVINVVPNSGPYNEVVAFGPISGSSAVNTVRINGNGNIVQFANTTNDRQLLKLEGTKYLTISNLTFKALATGFGWGAIINGGARYDSILNCTFDLSAVTSTTSGNTSGICFTGSLTAVTTAGDAKRCVVDGNTILGALGSGGPYYGITLPSGADSNVISNNTLANFYMYGIYSTSSSENLIKGNELHRANKTAVTTFYGIYCTGNVSGTVIDGNKLHSPGGLVASSTSSVYGIYMTSVSSVAANPTRVSNNLLYNINMGGLVYGIYLTTATNTLVYHNTVVIDKVLSGTSTNAGLYFTGTNTGSQAKNNLVSITAGTGGTKYGFYYSTAASVSDAQRNNIYVNSSQSGTQNYGYYTTAYATMAAFQAAYPAMEQGSVSVDPQFVNVATNNYMPGNFLLSGNGVTLTAVPFDIVGMPRAALPTPGAYEIPSIQGPDLGMVNLITPSGSYCAGMQPVSVSVMNSGTVPLTSFQIHWTLNNVPQTPYTFTGVLDTLFGTGQSIDTLTLGTVNIPAGQNSINAWVVLTGDMNDMNDTLSVTTSPAVFQVNSMMDTVCSGGDLSLNLSPSSGYATGAIEWQSSTNGITYAPILNADDPTYDATNLTNSTYFRVKINSGPNGCYSDTHHVYVTNPAITAAPNGFTCGPGTVQLNASATPGSTISWFDVPTGGTAIATGSSFTTPSITSNTTYYVQASTGGGVGQVGPVGPSAVGTGAGGGTAAAITTYHMAFDVLQPTTLISVDIYPTAAVGSAGTITIQNAASATIASVPYVTTVTGGATPQTVVLNVPLAAGTGYKMGQLAPAINLFRNTSGAVYPYTSSAINIVSNNFDPAYYYYFYNWQFASGCEGAIVPVTAEVRSVPSVDLGPDVSVCTDGTVTHVLNAGGITGATYMWDNGVTTPTRSVNSTGTYSVTVTANGCSNSDAVNVTFNNNPTVNLGGDTAVCDGVVLALNAGNPGASYLWDDMSTAAVRNVNLAGTYYVAVTDANDCVGRDTITLAINQAPMVNIGNDTAICSGTVLVLDAGNPGMPTEWDNGSTAQTRDVTDGGTYYVSVSAFGCVTTDSIHIDYLPVPEVAGINAVYGDSATYTFYPINALHAEEYTWNFGDGSPEVTGSTVQHTYAYNGIYTVTLHVAGVCEDGGAQTLRTVDVFDAIGDGTGIDKVSEAGLLTLYPNPAQSTLVVQPGARVQVRGIQVYNILGQLVYSEAAPKAASSYTIPVAGFTSGMYTLKLDTTTGTIHRKFEVLR
jgi:parallel beta-helix repeat protein